MIAGVDIYAKYNSVPYYNHKLIPIDFLHFNENNKIDFNIPIWYGSTHEWQFFINDTILGPFQNMLEYA